MTAPLATRPPAGPAAAPLLGGGFLAAVALRASVGGARSPVAGLVFAGCLLLLVPVRPPRARVGWRPVALGLGGAGVLLLPVVAGRGLPHGGGAGFAPWAAVVVVVALAEEAFLRGTLADLVAAQHGEAAAVVAGAVLFALLHLPLYGWSALPLDLAVGLLLGELRLMAGTWTAPGIAHVVADLGAWFLR